MTINARLLMFLPAVLLLQACSSTPLTPSQTAQHFWSALLSGDMDTAAKYATTGSRNVLKEQKAAYKDSSISFGKIALQSEQASIDTTIQLNQSPDSGGGDGGKAAKLQETKPSTFETILQKHKQQWQVDFVATQKSFDQSRQQRGLNRLVDDLNQLGHKFSKQLNDALQHWDEAKPQLKHDLENLGDSVQKDLQGAIDKYGPELQQNLQDFTDSIDKALDELHKKYPQAEKDKPQKDPEGRLI